jgi:cytochrome oxidase Cu insertion factor (SCO1/SenC/PrrC family)
VQHDHIYLIDPLGNLVLRYPKNAEPAKMKKDLERLLKYSRIG